MKCVFNGQLLAVLSFSTLFLLEGGVWCSTLPGGSVIALCRVVYGLALFAFLLHPFWGRIQVMSAGVTALLKPVYAFAAHRISALFCLLLMSAGIQAQSLLIDVTVSNTAPGPTDVFAYKIRYRCASITDHCYNAHITFTLPGAYDIVSTPGTGGNVASVTMTGNAVDIHLVSPPSAGAPAGALAAGASGILETTVKFKCGTNGVAPMPAAGSTVNFTVLPTFTVTTGSVVAAAPPAVTVPVVSACPVSTPNPPATTISKTIAHSTPCCVRWLALIWPMHSEGMVCTKFNKTKTTGFFE